MLGLDLSRRYFYEHGMEMIDTKFPQYKKYVAAGLAGEGSECFGFDDEISRDHDFGPGFCIWLPQEIYDRVGQQMQQAYDDLPKSYGGFLRSETPQGKNRVGVMPIGAFYKKFIGLDEAPSDLMKWFVIPERYLATAVNGEVFCDPYGEFSRIREALMGFYPEDVRRKKLANRVALMAQAGQYNYARCMSRREFYGAYLACGEFVKSTLSCIYLMNRRYMPFYKWAFRGTANLLKLSGTVDRLKRLVILPDTANNGQKKEAIIEEICMDVLHALKRERLTAGNSTFLLDHGEEIMKTIEDERLRSLHIMADIN